MCAHQPVIGVKKLGLPRHRDYTKLSNTVLFSSDWLLTGNVVRLKGTDNRNVWSEEYDRLPKLPKLGDFDDPFCPIPERFLDVVDIESSKLLNKWTEYPRLGSGRDQVFGKRLADRLRKVPTSTCRDAADILEFGVQLKEPSSHFPLKELSHDKETREERVRTRYYFVKEIAKGAILGPFEYTGQTHACVDTQEGEVCVKLRGTDIFWTDKRKTEQSTGRLITNSKKSGLNDDYNKDDAPCPLMNFDELVSDFSGQQYMAVCDFRRAYRQVHYAVQGWGLVTYVYEGKMYIDTRVTFGIRPGGGWFITIPKACSQLYTFEKLEKQGLSPHQYKEMELSDGASLRGTQSWHIDDGKIASTEKEVQDWIDWFANLDREYMGSDKALEWPLGMKPVSRGLYCGILHDLTTQRARIGGARIRKVQQRASKLLAGMPPVQTTGRGRFCFTKNELQKFAGSFESVAALHRNVRPAIIPIYRSMDKMKDDETPRNVPSHLIPWMKKGASRVSSVVARNAWVDYGKFITHNDPKERVTLVTDASGSFGAGGFCRKFKFPFQIRKEIYEPRLISLNDGNPAPCQINVAELLGPQLLAFLLKKRGVQLSDFQVWVLVDNSTARSDIKKGRSKHPGASLLADYLAAAAGYDQMLVRLVGTERMIELGGDELSRKVLRSFNGWAVHHVTLEEFNEFWVEVFGNM